MLGAALTRRGLGHWTRGAFTPHITLLYGERAVGEYPVAPAIGWRVNELVLIHSLHGHKHLGRWRFDV
jgi:2'-5' RNA ligase